MTDMTDAHSLTDDELAALLASGAWQIREFAYTGRGLSPEEFLRAAAEAVDLSLAPVGRERALTVVDRYAVDDLVAFKKDDYDGPPAAYAFVWTGAPEAVTLAFDYTPDETRRIYDFIRCRGGRTALPESLKDRVE